MYHLNIKDSFACVLMNLLIILSIFNKPCSSFLYEKIDQQLIDNKNARPPIHIDILTSLSDDLVVGKQMSVTAELNRNSEKPVIVKLVCEGEKCKQMLNGTEFGDRTLSKAGEKVVWKFELRTNGMVTLIVRPVNAKELAKDNIFINNGHSVKQLKVGKSHLLETWSLIIGYIYFVAWMVSLYPIVFTNFNRKSVIGLNFDFVVLNTTGYMAYAVYNICLIAVRNFQEAYFAKFPGNEIPVQFNDVLFAAHGSVINFLICLQCIFYERGDQKLTDIAKGILIAVYSPATILTLFFFLGALNGYYYITFFSYVKLVLTLCKYFPQAYFNYKRKSTIGWSVYYCFFDIIGGSFSILQMLINSINQDDFRNFTGNAGKFGLGLISIVFDLIFMVQHYVLYGKQKDQISQPVHKPSDYGSSKQFSSRVNSSTLRSGIRNDGFEINS